MKQSNLVLLSLMVTLMVTYPSILLVAGAESTQSESDLKEYVLNFVGAASYQLPEPASTLSSLLLAAPEGTKGALRAWAYQNLLSAERNYQNAADSGSVSQMNYYSNQSNRWQAVFSCLTGDCTNMQKLEGGSGSQQNPAVIQPTSENLVANGTKYYKGALLAGPISLPANWSDPQNILFLDKDRPYIVVGEGTCSLWDGQNDGVDSVYRYRTPLEPNGGELTIWGQLELIDPSIHLSDLMEKNAGKTAEYNSSHIYEAVVIGEGKELKARVFDAGGYSDNHGELKISIYNATRLS